MPFFRSVSCDQKYCKCMKAEQSEKTQLEELAWSETQLHFQGPLLALLCLHIFPTKEAVDPRDFSDYNRWSIAWVNPIISDDRLWNLSRFPTLLYINIVTVLNRTLTYSLQIQLLLITPAATSAVARGEGGLPYKKTGVLVIPFRG